MAGSRHTAPPDAALVEQRVHDALARAWTAGWQPRDIVHLARKRSAREASFAVSAIAAQSASYVHDPAVDPEWRAQLVEIGALEPGGGPVRSPGLLAGDGRLRAALELLGWLARLHPIPPIGGRPGAWHPLVASAPARRRTSDPVINKVRALLAKAESTDFPDEAEAFSAKAQELITRHAIDRAVLDTGSEEAPFARRVPIDDPHAEAKLHLLSQVAAANRCQAVWHGAYGFATVVGFAGDLDSVELLFASLLVQANRALAAIGRRAAPGSHSRSARFRRGFLHGFASEIGDRLCQAAEQSTTCAAERHGDALLPVLARRDEAVEAERDRLFPRITQVRARRTDYHGWVAGSAAGRVASLGLDGAVVPHLGA